MQVKLTASLVRRATQGEPPTRDTSYFDLDVPRFGLRAFKPRRTGLPWASHYFIRYAIEGRERHMKIAPGSLPLDEARRKARIELAKVDAGNDPAQAKAEARAAWTLAEAAAAYIATPEFRRRPERSQREDKAVLKLHLVHHLGREKLRAIDVPMVRGLIRRIEADTRTNARKRRLGGPGAARRAVRVLSALMTWATGEGHLKGNPLIGNLRKSGDGMRETVITTREEYTRLFTTMRSMVEAGELRASVESYFIVVAATGMRRGEVQALRWADIDLSERRVRLTTSKGARLARKSGPRVETISLPLIAAAAIEAIRPDNPEPGTLVFVPKRGERLSVNRDWRAVCARAGLPEELVIHGLRHSAATVGVLSGLSLAHVQRLLRHRSIAVTQRYLHLAEAASGRLADQAMAGVLPALLEADAAK